MYLSRKVLTKALIAFNILFLLSGCASVAVGIWMIFDPGLLDLFYGMYKFLHPSSLLIGGGLLTFLVTFCGIGGAYKENKCVLRTFIVFLTLIMAAQFVAGGLAFSYRRTVNAEIYNHTLTVVKQRYASGEREVDYAVDLLQERFKCCGASGKDDYIGSEWAAVNKVPGKTVPESCCRNPIKCAKQTVVGEVFTQGCTEKLYTLAQDRFLVLGGLGVAVGGVQLIIMVLAFALNFALDQVM